MRIPENEVHYGIQDFELKEFSIRGAVHLLDAGSAGIMMRISVAQWLSA